MKVFHTDLSYESVEETESYPLEEMINELAGVCGLYFGFSVISIASFFRGMIEKFRRTHPQQATEDLEMSIRLKSGTF